MGKYSLSCWKYFPRNEKCDSEMWKIRIFFSMLGLLQSYMIVNFNWISFDIELNSKFQILSQVKKEIVAPSCYRYAYLGFRWWWNWTIRPWSRSRRLGKVIDCSRISCLERISKSSLGCQVLKKDTIPFEFSVSFAAHSCKRLMLKNHRLGFLNIM